MALITSVLMALQMFELHDPVMNRISKLNDKMSSECELCGKTCSLSGKTYTFYIASKTGTRVLYTWYLWSFYIFLFAIFVF